MLSLKNKKTNYSIFSAPFVIMVLISVTLIRIYSLIISPIELYLLKIDQILQC